MLVVGETGVRARTVDALASLGSVEAVAGAETAIDRLESATRGFDGAVVVGGRDHLDCCERLREWDSVLPVVFAPPEEGDERLAADAVAAGASAYVPTDASEEALCERVAAALADGTTDAVEDRRSRRALRSELESLRESEELHRVVLNHMTDTVLVTDDAGAFTYVCPNVHFVFGYTAEEIYELGTIDELLGSDVIDREALREQGVLTNVECTATDKRGAEHALLVNAREVDIQGGTILYSCRDVTARKRREEALTALHRTARKLLYAETEAEIVELVIDEAAEVLDLEASAVFLFDDETNAMAPAAHSDPMERLCGPPGRFRVNAENTVGFSYLERESLFLADLDGPAATSDAWEPGTLAPGDASSGAGWTGDATAAPPSVVSASLPANPDAAVESAAYVPLGDHGVFVAGSESADRFDAVARELAELLAAAAEAALDRVERESALREQDRELQTRNRRLARLDRINEIIRDVVAALVRASSREEIERAVCDRLTESGRFPLAWIGVPEPATDVLEVRAQGGDDRGYLETGSIEVADDERVEPAGRAASTREVTVVSNVADDLREGDWRTEALSRDFQSVISVPLAYDEVSYGVLTVYADRPDAFDDVSRPVLAELGQTIASAMGALERKSALLTTSSARIEFDVRDDEFVLQRLASEADCRLAVDGAGRGAADGSSVFVTVSGGSAEDVVTAATDLVAVDAAQVITGDADGGTVRLELARPFVSHRLAEHGVVLRRASADAAGGRLVVDVPSAVDVRGIVDVLRTSFASVDLVSKETVERTGAGTSPSALRERLTDRQLEVAQVAYYGGYYEEPRDQNGEAIADTLGISPAAFYSHDRTVQRRLVEALFEGDGRVASRRAGDDG